ncbi:MAG: helix-turn-helix domain-containing protein [Chloroflexota bacterium]
MMTPQADLILHPVRLRIVMAVVGRELTVRQIAEALPDVAQATLYRHINALAESGVLDVVAETPVRGTVEKTYALTNLSRIYLTADDICDASKDDHLRYFTAFVSSLLGAFSSYLQSRETIDPEADGVGYRIHSLYLSDEELAEFSMQFGELMRPFAENDPTADRKRRLFSTIFIPADNESTAGDEAEEA